MVRRHIKKIPNPIARGATYALLAMKLLFLKLVVIKTIVFNIAALKVIVAESLILMGVFALVPHITLAQGNSVDYSISNSTYPMMTAEWEVISYLYYFQQEWGTSIHTDNVQITATIPAGMTYHSHEWVAPTSTGGNQVVWNFPAPDNVFGLVVLRLLVQPSASWPLHNTVTLTHTNNDTNLANNTATATVFAQQAGQLSDADLYVTNNVNISQASLIDQIVYTIEYGNNWSETANDAVLYKVLPQELYVVSSSQAPNNIQNGNLYVFNIWNINPWQTGSVQITASLFPIAQQGQTVQTHAVISSQSVEQNINNNISTTSITVQDPLPTMQATIAAQKNSICIDDTVRFTVTIQNNSVFPAYDISVRHSIPSTMSFVWSNKSYTHNPPIYTWNYAVPFFWWSQQMFYFDLKWVSTASNQSIAIVAYEGNQEVAKASTNITISNCSGGWGWWQDPSAIMGCMDPEASNFNPDATVNRWCIYTDDEDEDNEDDTDTDTDTDTGGDDDTNDSDNQDQTGQDTDTNQIPGCTNPAALNYNPNATQNNGSCTFAAVPWCTDPTALNYNPSATQNNGLCTYPEDPTDPTGDPWSDLISALWPLLTPGPTIWSGTNFLSVNNNNGTQITHQNTAPSLIPTPTNGTAHAAAVLSSDTPTSNDCLRDGIRQSAAYAVWNSVIGDIHPDHIARWCEPAERWDVAALAVQFALNYRLTAWVIDHIHESCVFSDIYDTNLQYYAGVACSLGLMWINMNGIFDPRAHTTRAEVAMVVDRVLFAQPIITDPWYVWAMGRLDRLLIMNQNLNNPDSVIDLAWLFRIFARAIEVADVLNPTQ